MSTKKSLFSLLSFGRGNNSNSKDKLKSKESSKERSASLPAELSAKTPPKTRTFPHLKIPKSKDREKVKRKYLVVDPKEEKPCDISSENSTEGLLDRQFMVETKVEAQDTQNMSGDTSIGLKDSDTSIGLKDSDISIGLKDSDSTSTSPSLLTPPPIMENGVAPKASEDSFSDTEEDTRGSRGHQMSPEKKEKIEKDKEREKKVQRVVQKVQRQQKLKRLRTAQEIQRRLEELEVKHKELEQQGVEVEKLLRGENGGQSKEETVLMQEWFTLVHAKNKVIREEQELLIRAKDLQLEDCHSRLQQEMRERMSKSDSSKSAAEIEEERHILSEMLEIVEKRDELVAMLEQLRIKEKEEDKDLECRMLAKGLQLSPIDKS